MKINGTEATWLLTVILAFHIPSIQVEADSDGLRVLSLGLGGSSRLSAADLLSGGKASGQQHRETHQTPVMTDEERPMMLVSGPNLCEEDTDTQSFSTALLLSSPGPHAVLLLLHPEDQPAGQCDPVRQAQELLGERVLQFCIVLLIQDQQEPLTAASREMIRACGGRFHIMSAAQPKPAALVAEIHKLVWLNDGRFYSTSTQERSEDVNEENQLGSGMWILVEVSGWFFLISLFTLAVYTKGIEEKFNFGAKFAALVLFMFYLRHFLSSYVAIPLNLALISSLAFTLNRFELNIRNVIEFNSNEHTVMSFLYVPTSALVIGSLMSVRTWSDVLLACYIVPGLSCATSLLSTGKIISLQSPLFTLKSFPLSLLGSLLSVGFVNVCFALFGVALTVITFFILSITMAYLYFKSQTDKKHYIRFAFFVVIFPCACVLTGSVFLILGTVMSFLKANLEILLSSYLFYAALLYCPLCFGVYVLCRQQTASVDDTDTD